MTPLFCFFQGIFSLKAWESIPSFCGWKGGNMKVGETYTGEELCELCGVDEDPTRYVAVVGKKASVIAVDAGNDNYQITHIVEGA